MGPAQKVIQACIANWLLKKVHENLASRLGSILSIHYE
jgi:hypothetical protein